MALQNVTIGRICLHEVYVRADEGAVVPPTFGGGLLNLPPAALDAFRSRVVAAFKSSAQCMEMTIREHGPGSVLANGVNLLELDDAEFVKSSRLFASALARAQTSRQIPGGLVVVFDGMHDNPAKRFFAVMKAELHDGFLKTANLQAQFVSSLFLSPKTKLYKIGFFSQSGQGCRATLPEGWSAIVYDSAMTASQRDNAATYFYSAFLGLDIPANAAQIVKTFFEQTKDFIRSTDLPEERKADLYNGLYAYLKLDQGNTIQTSAFAETYLGDDLATDYLTQMRRHRFPDTAIAKDISEIQGVLRWRRFKFPRAIVLSGPPEAVRDLVTVEAINGADGAGWTRVTIKGRLEAQE